ncbi:hypothetical protein AYO44_11355 [Planctomycetaceae bacterium SCGC AG-212-F19]|nr:hypothetical protein AYO44_11355 [Planctomycetaceae bacterium SCGC AG-212-F19]
MQHLFPVRAEPTPEQKAQQAANQQAARTERQAQKVAAVEEHHAAAERLFCAVVLPGMQALAPLTGIVPTADVNERRLVASCQCPTKRGRLDVRMILEPETDGTLTMTAEAAHEQDNPLSRRAVLPLDPPGAAARWIEDRLGECARIRALLEK